MSRMKLYLACSVMWLTFLLGIFCVYECGKYHGQWELMDKRIGEIEKRVDEIDDQLEYGVH